MQICSLLIFKLLEEEKSSIRAPEDRYIDNRSGSGYPVECFRLLGASSYNDNVCMEFWGQLY